MISPHTLRQIRPAFQSISNLATCRCLPLVAFAALESKSKMRTSFQTTTTIRNANTLSARPFKILGLQQVAVGSTDAASMKKLWVDTFGLEKIGSYASEKENVAEDILKVGTDENGSVSVEIDLMCPLDEDKSPKVNFIC